MPFLIILPDNTAIPSGAAADLSLAVPRFPDSSLEAVHQFSSSELFSGLSQGAIIFQSGSHATED